MTVSVVPPWIRRFAAPAPRWRPNTRGDPGFCQVTVGSSVRARPGSALKAAVERLDPRQAIAVTDEFEVLAGSHVRGVDDEFGSLRPGVSAHADRRPRRVVGAGRDRGWGRRGPERLAHPR